MFNVKSVDEVIKIINDNFEDYNVENEEIDILEAVNRVTAENFIAHEDIPGFNRSSVDGYAVISSDTFGASEALPAQLELIGEVKMGEKPEFLLQSGQTVYIPTGGELPVNADSVVMIEYTEYYEDGFIYINKAAAPGNNVVFKGDDTKVGNIAVKANISLRPQDIGILAVLGYDLVKVKRKIRVGIISTGDEIIDISKKPEGSQVRDVNSYSLYAGLVNYSAEPKLYGIINDDYVRLRYTLETAIQECDVVLISGGSSVGNKDETYKVISSLNDSQILVHGIAVKPGKPTILAKIGNKAVIGLPGHPASAYMIFQIFVCYLMDVINATKREIVKTVKAVMSSNYPSNNGREEFLLVRVENENGSKAAYPVFGKSGLITTLTMADGFVHIGRNLEGISKGKEVEVKLF